jgi:protein involved in polysaccharide export with SLBB domain
VQDVEVAGMTTNQIRQKLEELYGKYYKEPEILVTVQYYRSKKIFVYGEVRRVGPYPYTGYQTVIDAMGLAGGVTNRAAWGRVTVTRGDPENPQVFKVDLGKLLLSGDTRYDVTLAENDVVYVPPTALAWLGYQIQSLLFPTSSAVSLISQPERVGTTTGATGGTFGY